MVIQADRPIAQPIQGNFKTRCFYTLAKHKKTSQVALAALGITALAVGIYRPSIISFSVATVTLGASYNLEKIIRKNFSHEDEVLMTIKIWRQTLPEESARDGKALEESIKSYFENQNRTDLDLSQLKILSLPDIFNSPALNKLKILDLTWTHITSLPESLNKHPTLKELHLYDTCITSLPDNFNPPNLEKLCLYKTPITALPNAFTASNLKNLDLSNTRIINLPDNFNPSNLEYLSLYETPITALPNAFTASNLKNLDLSNTRIINLPDNFNPPKLEELCLSGPQVKGLPDKFNPSNLRKLHLSGLQIRSLPDGLNKHPNLRDLKLSDTQIINLSDSFNPPKLEELHLSGPQVKGLPDKFNPLNLKELHLSGPEVKDLPNGFNPPNLKTLDLTHTGITSLPNDFNYQSLKTLLLCDTPITNIPTGLNNLPNLEYLNFAYSHITNLTENLNFPGLKRFDLFETPIISLPESILNLPRTCTVCLTISNFSNAVRTHLEECTSQEGYNGPRFEYGINDYNAVNSFKTIFEALNKVLEASKTKNTKTLSENFLATFSNAAEQGNLKIWVDRLFQTASAKSENSTMFFKSVVEILKQATEKEEMKELLLRVLDDANSTCGDRVALSVLHLGMQAKLNTQESAKDLYTFLVKTIYAMDNLENTARNIVPTLPLKDPLEVYLGLPIKLKEEFKLDINIDNMLYFACSSLTEEHLKQARDNLTEALEDKDKVLNFLIGQPKWQEVLKKSFPKDMEEASEQRDEDCIDPDKAVNALSIYNEKIKALSLKLIASFQNNAA